MALQQFAAEQLWRRQVATRLDALPAAYLRASKTYDPPSLNDGEQTTTTITVPLAGLGDMALASFDLDTQGVVLTAQVTAADTVTVTLRNDTGAPVDLPEGTLAAGVLVANAP